MGRTLKPQTLELESSDPDAGKKLTHWIRCVTSFIKSMDTDKDDPVDHLEVLIQLVSHQLYELIEEAANFDAAIKILKDQFIKSPNIIYARHMLITKK